jgi:hypothetical protein
MTFAKLVKELAKEFEAKAGKEHAATLTQLLKDHETDFQEAFSKKKSKKTENPDAPKRTNWQAVWTSNENGCRSYPDFKGALESLQKENGEMGRFELNKKLRQWADANNKYSEWQQWARERLEKEGKPVPPDTKTEAETAKTETETAKTESAPKDPKPKGKKAPAKKASATS